LRSLAQRYPGRAAPVCTPTPGSLALGVQVGRFEDYRFISKNLPVVVGDPVGRPDFSGPLLPEQVRVQIRKVLLATVGSGLMADQAWRTILGRHQYELGKNLPRPGG